MPQRIKKQRIKSADAALSGTGADVLTALAPLLRIKPVIEDFCRFAGAWASPHAPLGGGAAQFHIVTRGTCVLERPGQEKLTLEAGDILLLPHGDTHLVRSARRGSAQPGGSAANLVVSEFRNGVRARTTSLGDADTELLCGRLVFAGASSPLVSLLPDHIVIRTAHKPALERFKRLLTDIRDELDGGKMGAEAIAADMARALFVMLLRDHFEEGGPEDAGLLPLLRDRITARVALAILRDPARAWTLEAMAGVGLSSRATLVRQFRKWGGTAPMNFLTDLRLTIARQRLAGTDEPVARIAADTGYQSESALSRAMLRKFGLRPGALRGLPP